MKTQNRVLALVLTLVLAFVMTFSLAVTAFAEDETPTTYTITVKNAVTGHTYTAYQVFSGVLAEDEVTLSNIDWGEGVDGTALLEALTEGEIKVDGANPFAECKTAKDVADVLSTCEDSSEVPNAFARLVNHYVVEDKGVSATTEGDTATITVNEVGYYVVVDEGAGDKTDAYSLSMLKVVGDATVNVKTDLPKVEKKVKDINDSTDTETTDWQDSADHDFNDTVLFQLTGTLPSNYGDYKTYKYVFHDTMSQGLDLVEGSIKVYAVPAEGERIDITTSFKINKAEYTASGDASNDKYDGGTKLTIACDDLKKAGDFDATYSIVVEYSAKLNDHAVIGEEGNPNKVKLQYSNNPNWDGKGEPGDEPGEPEEPTGETEEDVVIVFTYEMKSTKTDGASEEENAPLEGAGFTLYKWYATGAELPKDAVIDDPNAPEAAEGGKWVVVGTIVTNEKGEINFKGLDDGDYVLVETTVPDGYNKADDIYFTIKAEHDKDSNEPKLNELGVYEIGKTGEDDLTLENWESDVKEGTIGTTIENNKGAQLPSTGGIGTTIFYIVGGLLVVFAGVLLITKSRMKSRG